MKKIKKLLMFTLALTAIVICFAFSSSAAKTGVYTYTVKNGKATINRVDSGVGESIIIPAYINGYKVSTIGEYCFQGCENLKYIIMPNTVTKIDDVAFYECTYLQDFTIPESVTTIGHAAFSWTSIEKIYISKNVKNISINPFIECQDLTEINVDPDNKYYCDVDGVLFNKDKTELIAYPSGNARKTYTIPSSVKTIRGGAFFSCHYLEKVTIPNGVTKIFSETFANTTRLKEVSIPDTIKSVEDYAFACSALEVVHYRGTKKMWKKKEFNGYFTNDDIHYCNQKIKKQPTYTNAGTLIYKCGKCAYTYSQAIPKKVLSTTSKVKSSGTTSTIKLSWSKVSGASGYRVFQKVSNKWKKLSDTDKLTYTVKKLDSGTTYTFAIRPYVKENKKNIFSKKYTKIETSTQPLASTLKVTSTAKGKATLTWSNPSGESGFEIYYSTKKDSGFKKIATTKANSTKATVSKLQSKKTYYFKVRSFKTTQSGKAYSAYSAVKSVKVK